MQVAEETLRAMLADRARETQQLRLVRRALQAKEEEASGRGQRPANHRYALFFGRSAVRRRLRAFGHA